MLDLTLFLFSFIFSFLVLLDYFFVLNKYCRKSFSQSWIIWIVQEKKKYIKENIVIFYLILFLKINKENKRKRREKLFCIISIDY